MRTLRDTRGRPWTVLPTTPHCGQDAWRPRSHCLPPGVTGHAGSRPSHTGRGRGRAPPPGEVSARPTDSAPLPSPQRAGGVCWTGGTRPVQPSARPRVTWAGEGPTCTRRPSCLRAAPARGGGERCPCSAAGGSRDGRAGAGRPTRPPPLPRPLKAECPLPAPGALALKAACPVAFGGAQLQPREAATTRGHGGCAATWSPGCLGLQSSAHPLPGRTVLPLTPASPAPDLLQVEVTRAYLAKQVDEITLQQADVVLILQQEDGECAGGGELVPTSLGTPARVGSTPAWAADPGPLAPEAVVAHARGA